jgi:hypothetical protein
MKLFTCLTPSHTSLFERHFEPSVALSGLGLQPPRLLPERAESAYDTPGFRRSCELKIDYLLEALSTETEPFVFSDVDVCFYGSVVEDLLELADPDFGRQGVLFQSDGPERACSGFMLWHPSSSTRDLVGSVRKVMTDQELMDQDAFHHVMRERKMHPALLPERYWTVGRMGQRWLPGMTVRPPKNLLMHHANWTVGVENKLRLLAAVKMSLLVPSV